MNESIEIPRDLEPGDIAICNHGERLVVDSYDRDGDLHTNDTTDWRNTWRKDGRNWSVPNERWIVAIERKTKPKKKANPDKDAAYLLRLADKLERDDANANAKRLRQIARRINKETP